MDDIHELFKPFMCFDVNLAHLRQYTVEMCFSVEVTQPITALTSFSFNSHNFKSCYYIPASRSIAEQDKLITTYENARELKRLVLN